MKFQYGCGRFLVDGSGIFVLYEWVVKIDRLANNERIEMFFLGLLLRWNGNGTDATAQERRGQGTRHLHWVVPVVPRQF